MVGLISEIESVRYGNICAIYASPRKHGGQSSMIESGHHRVEFGLEYLNVSHSSVGKIHTGVRL